MKQEDQESDVSLQSKSLSQKEKKREGKKISFQMTCSVKLHKWNKSNKGNYSYKFLLNSHKIKYTNIYPIRNQKGKLYNIIHK